MAGLSIIHTDACKPPRRFCTRLTTNKRWQFPFSLGLQCDFSPQHNPMPVRPPVRHVKTIFFASQIFLIMGVLCAHFV